MEAVKLTQNNLQIKNMTYSKERQEERSEILQELYNHNLAEQMTKMPISENTRAALYFKGKVQDVSNTLFSLHKLMFTYTDDETSDKFCQACRELNEIADEYIAISINENISFLHPTEI